MKMIIEIEYQKHDLPFCVVETIQRCIRREYPNDKINVRELPPLQDTLNHLAELFDRSNAPEGFCLTKHGVANVIRSWKPKDDEKHETTQA